MEEYTIRGFIARTAYMGLSNSFVTAEYFAVDARDAVAGLTKHGMYVFVFNAIQSEDGSVTYNPGEPIFSFKGQEEITNFVNLDTLII